MLFISFTLPSALVVNPQIKKTTRVMLIEGIVVHIMYLMWVKRSVPAIAGARFVVSDRGDILSPK